MSLSIYKKLIYIIMFIIVIYFLLFILFNNLYSYYMFFGLSILIVSFLIYRINPTINIGISLFLMCMNFNRFNFIAFDYIFSETIQKIIIFLFILPNTIEIIKVNKKKKKAYIFYAYLYLFFQTYFFSSKFYRLSVIDSLFSIATALIGILFLNLLIENKKKETYLLSFLIILLPLFSVSLSLILFGYKDTIRIEYNVIRLKGLLSPAHLAFLTYNSIIFLIMNRKIINNKAIYIFFLIINYIILFLTVSRTAIFLSILFIVLDNILINEQGQKSKTKINKIIKNILTILFILLILIIFYQNITIRFIPTTNNEIINTSGRYMAWNFYMMFFKNNIFFGNGVGSIKLINEGQINIAFKNSHNEYIKTLVEYGLIGFFVFWLSFILTYISILKNENINNPKTKHVVLYIVMFLLYSITDNTLSTIQSWFMFNFVINYTINYSKNT